MESQIDLNNSIRQLLKRKNNGVPSPASLGTITGSNLKIDGFDLLIPLSDVLVLQHWQGNQSEFVKPKYKSGDRVLVIERADSDYIIVGKV